MRITPVQNSFTSGEISPRLQARFDMDAYYSGAAKLVNFVCTPHGPLIRRQGTTFIAQAKTNDVRLIPFRFSTTNSLILEFGNQYIRFYYDGGQVMTAPDSDTPYEIVSPYTAEQIHNIDWAQSGDTLYIVHPNVAPQKLVRTANNNWSISAVTFTNKPENWTGTNWPSHIVFHEQRLFYAATPNRPQTIWGSRTGLYDEFTMKDANNNITADMAIAYTIASDEVNGIVWMKAVDNLTLGTAGAEYQVTAGSYTEALSPTNIRIKRQTSYGASLARVQQVGAGVVFPQRGGTRVRYFEYGYVEDQYTAVDLTITAEHILKGKIKELDMQTVQDTYVWCVLQNGDLVGLTYEKQQKVLGWHRHDLGGAVKSVAVIPGDPSDEVWVAVTRTINNNTVTYIEAFLDAFSEVDSPDEGFYADSHLYYDDEMAIAVVGGLDHLEGCEVTVNVDGWVHPNVIVENGSITLQQYGKRIVVGLPYESRLETCTIQSSDQVIMGNLKRFYAAKVSVLKTLGLTMGVIGYPEQTIFMGPTMVMNKAKELFTGTLDVRLPASSDREIQVFATTTMPLPCEIRAIKYEIEVNQ